MTTQVIGGIVMGFAGSFHCVGMCGPLALSLPVQHLTGSARYAGLILYNLGRVVTYSLFGLLIGLFGKSLPLAGMQQWLSITAGLLILFYLAMDQFGVRKTQSILSPLFDRVRKQIGKLYQKKSFANLFAIGVLNGFLPCGFVYLAMAGSIAAEGVYESVLFMAGFGMGTLPAMLSVNVLGNLFGISFRSGIKRIYPYVMGLVALLLIVRGMSLDIPYLSPKIEKQKVHECCHKQ
ncbi:MAG: sulfite exporter TauE/SafE family protein [Bacteroidetes bacterium]|nr:sulfite exporter TauE/SafE family protein [Bacteroidota bacterium]